jgi:hypothetical protein
LQNSDLHWSLDCHQRLGGISEDVSMAAFPHHPGSGDQRAAPCQRPQLADRLQRTPPGLALSIQDDGRGFVPAQAPADANAAWLACRSGPPHCKAA